MAKRWEYYTGKSLIGCGGRCISAKNLSIFYLTLALIVVSSGLFLAFDCRLLAVNVSAAVPVLAVIQFLFVLSCLLRTTFTDPGIIPRGTADEAAWIETELEGPKLDRDGNFRPPARIKDVQINGRTFKLKYCFTCKIWRPPRASHCSTCDNCVDRFDHHCPWVGNCVGRRNYRYFYLFLTSLSVYCFYVMIFGIVNLVMLANMRKDFLLAVKESPTSMLTILVAFFSIWSVVGLGGFHTLLLCRETSTNEDIKGSFNSRRNPDMINPFDQGNGLANCCYVLFGPVAPSLLRFTEDAERGYGVSGGHGFDSNLSLLTNGRNGPAVTVVTQTGSSASALAAVPAVHYSNHHQTSSTNAYIVGGSIGNGSNGKHNPALASGGGGSIDDSPGKNRVSLQYPSDADDTVISGGGISGTNQSRPPTSVSYIV